MGAATCCMVDYACDGPTCGRLGCLADCRMLVLMVLLALA